MLNIFGVKYKAISNLFVDTVEGESFTFPAPIALYAAIEETDTSSKNIFDIKVNSVQDSILSLSSSYLSLFFYALSFEYKVNVFYLDNLILSSDIQSDMYGYKGTYQFVNTNIAMNIGLDEVFDQYKKIKDSMLEYEWVRTD